MMAGIFSVTLLAILPALFVVSICCHSESRKRRAQDKDLIVRESLPFNSKNNPMKARRESQRNGATRYEVDPLGAPTFSTFQGQNGSSIDKTPPLEAPPTVSSTPLEYTLFSSSLSRSPLNTADQQISSLSHSLVNRVSMNTSEHIPVSSFMTNTQGHHSVASPSHTIQSHASHPNSHDTPQCSTFTVIPRSTGKRTDSYSSNASGISYDLTGARLSEFSELSVSGQEGDIVSQKTHVVNIGQQNTTSEGKATVASRTTETDESNPIVTQRRPTFTVKVYQHIEKTPVVSKDIPLQSSMTILPSSSPIPEREAEVPPRRRPFSEGDIIDNDFETSLDKGKRSFVPKLTKGETVSKQDHIITPSKDAKKKKQNQTKKNLKKKAPISPPHSPPPLPPIPVAPSTTEEQYEVERETGKKSRAPTPIAAKTMEVHTPTSKRHNRIISLTPPHTPPPLPPLPPIPTTPLAYQFQSSIFSAHKSPDMIIKCSNCGQEIKESGNDSAHSSPKTHNDYSSDNLPLKRKKSGHPSYHILQSGLAICMECLMKDAPIYHELEVHTSDEDEATCTSPPPIPPRDYPPPPPKSYDPVYERVGSLGKKDRPEGLSSANEENSITRSRKPKSLVLRTGLSTDYESIPSLNSTNQHQGAQEFSQRTTRYPGHRTLPPLHLQLSSYLEEDMLESNEQHDYESLTTISDEQHVAVNMGMVGQRKGSHDYACIGAAPSMESLPSPDSPPFVPEGAKRVQLLKIDSEGYASVMPLQDDEIDCLTFSEQREQCMIQPELPVCNENDMWRFQQQEEDPGYAPLVPRRESDGSTAQSHGGNNVIVPHAIPQDYEVPVNCLASMEVEQTSSRRNSHVLTRQKAITLAETSSTEDDQSRRASHQRASDMGTHYLESDHDLEDTEEVFDDSGIETSVDLQDQVSREKRQSQHGDGSGEKTTATARASSLGNTGTVFEMDESFHRPRAITLHNVKFHEDQDKDQGERRRSAALRISLDQTSQAVV